jgi:hypothetical protein
MGEWIGAYRVVVGKSEGKIRLGRPGLGCESNIVFVVCFLFFNNSLHEKLNLVIQIQSFADCIGNLISVSKLGTF